MELILIDNYSARPFSRDTSDLFIDLKLVRDDMENIPVKFAKVFQDRFSLCLITAFGLGSVEGKHIEGQLNTLFNKQSDTHVINPFTINVNQYTFLQLEQQPFPCIYVQNNQNTIIIKEMTDKNKDEIILLIQNYVDFLEELNSTQIQYMILRVFEDLNDQSSQILGIIKDCIENNQEDEEEEEEEQDSHVYEKVQFQLYQ